MRWACSSKSFRSKERVTFCPVTKSHQKTPSFLTYSLVRERTSLVRARTARILRAITLDPSLCATGIKSLETLNCTKPQRRGLKGKILSALQASPLWLSACVFTRLFIPVTCRSRATVVARRDARVRDQQHGRAVRGQRPLGEKKSFFGDFLPISKKLPASRRIAEALFSKKPEPQ